MSFDFRKVEYFLAAMEHRNISMAAEALRVSQPTLSRQISAMERQFRTPLFVRHGRGVTPTQAGLRLYEGIRGLEHQFRSLRDEVASAANEATGEVAFGIPPSPRTLLALDVIAAFTTAYPRVMLRIREQTSGEIRDLLASGEIDLALVNSEEPLHQLISDPLVTEPLLLVGPPEAKLSLARDTPVERLADLPLILTMNPNSLRRVVETRLQQRGLRPIVQIEANTLPLMTDLVERGLGYTVLPACGALALLKAGRISASPIRDVTITWTLARPIDRNLSTAARLLYQVTCRTILGLIESGVWSLARLHRDCPAAIRSMTARATEQEPPR